MLNYLSDLLIIWHCKSVFKNAPSPPQSPCINSEVWHGSFGIVGRCTPTTRCLVACLALVPCLALVALTRRGLFGSPIGLMANTAGFCIWFDHIWSMFKRGEPSFSRYHTFWDIRQAEKKWFGPGGHCSGPLQVLAVKSICPNTQYGCTATPKCQVWRYVRKWWQSLSFHPISLTVCPIFHHKCHYPLVIAIENGQLEIVDSLIEFSLVDLSSSFFVNVYPLVNIQKTMERSTIFNGKIHYFYGHFQ